MTNKIILTKINQVKLHLLTNKIEKTGHNDFSNFDSFTLEDLVPKIELKAIDLGLFNKVTFFSHKSETISNEETGETRVEYKKAKAILTITDIESGETDETVFEYTEDPMRKIGATDGGYPSMFNIQVDGAITTYLRRYLFLIAYDIVERDAIDIKGMALITDDTKKKAKEIDKETDEEATKVTLIEKIKADFDSKLIKQLKEGKLYKNMTIEELEELYSKLKSASNQKVEDDGSPETSETQETKDTLKVPNNEPIDYKKLRVAVSEAEVNHEGITEELTKHIKSKGFTGFSKADQETLHEVQEMLNAKLISN